MMNEIPTSTTLTRTTLPKYLDPPSTSTRAILQRLEDCAKNRVVVSKEEMIITSKHMMKMSLLHCGHRSFYLP